MLISRRLNLMKLKKKKIALPYLEVDIYIWHEDYLIAVLET